MFENTPFGIPVFSAALIIAEATNSPVPECIACDFTITGQPDANALAVSPPAVENAKGKLLAANTTTGPNGIDVFLISDLGNGCLVGIASSIVSFLHSSFETKSAKALN